MGRVDINIEAHMVIGLCDWIMYGYNSGPWMGRIPLQRDCIGSIPKHLDK